jgi:hypothetical protein
MCEAVGSISGTANQARKQQLQQKDEGLEMKMGLHMALHSTWG